jgi:hexosaminidase
MSREATGAPMLNLMPWPRRLRRHEGALALGALQVEWAGARSIRLEAAFSRTIASMLRLTGGEPAQPVRCQIVCRGEAPPLPALDDDESYQLTIDAGGARLGAATEWGVLRGLATLVQLPVPMDKGWRLPFVEIEDAPRFAWRGVMLDPARRFLSLDALRRTLDTMAFYKLNVLHLHLSDDQGFRFPSQRFSRLPEIGGSAQFYSRDDIRALVNHAAALGIRVVPELDMPGHCTSWLAAHPEWGARTDELAVSDRFGVHEAVLDPTRDEVMAAVGALLAELAELFPDAFVHIGGDEVNPAGWNQNADICRHIESAGLSGPADLQAAFNRNLGDMLTALGKRMVGWDEICHPSLARSAVVQTWRGSAARDLALAAGHDCLVSAGYYLDLFYPADLHYCVDPAATPEADAARDTAMLGDPRLAHVREGLRWMARFAAGAARTAAATDAARPGRVLGGEACLWGELVSEAVLDIRLWTRMPAIAERLWSDAGVTDADIMYVRLDASRQRLAQAGGLDLDAARARLFQSFGMSADEYQAIVPLLDTLEPVKWYARLLGKEAMLARVAGIESDAERPYGTTTPLNRVVDYLPPESLWSRALDRTVDVLLADPTRHDLCDELARSAVRWRTQRALLREIAHRAPALTEIEPLAEALGQLSQVLLRCLAAFPVGMPAAERDQLDADLIGLSAPHAEIVIAVTPAIQRLLHACTGTHEEALQRGH